MKILNRFAFICTFLVLSFVARADSSHPPKQNFDLDKLKEIPLRMQQFVDDRTIAGAVTLVARHGEIVSIDTAGYADMSQKKAMRPDALFWIASMTKPITATAIMILQDEGKLSVEDPVEKHLPEFKGQWLFESKTSNTATLVRAPRPITIRDLLTHTSGLGDVPSPRPFSTLAELVMAYSQVPLQFPPGSKWSYCNSGINTLGRIVEVVSGQKYEEFLDQRIFKPLDMKDTTFWPSESQARRVAKSYQPASSGSTLDEIAISFLPGPISSRKRTPLPAGGLFSTARDMYRFYQMALNGGTWNGKRIVSEEAIKTMTKTQTGDIKTGFVDGMSFGFGYAVVKQPTGITGMLSKGTFGHGGAYGTQGWVDPDKDMILVLMIQRAKLPNADNSDIRKAFQEAAVAAMRE